MMMNTVARRSMHLSMTDGPGFHRGHRQRAHGESLLTPGRSCKRATRLLPPSLRFGIRRPAARAAFRYSSTLLSAESSIAKLAKHAAYARTLRC